MSEMMENKLNSEELNEVTGGTGRQEIHVRAITPHLGKSNRFQPELQIYSRRTDRQDL